MPLHVLRAAGLLLALPYAAAQLSGRVGPTTTTSQKTTTKVCNIMDYGGAASATTDNSAAIASAWAACKTGGQVYIPAGDYGLQNWLSLSGGQSVSINLEGTIYRTGIAGGNMILIEKTNDFELYSATGTGAVQGYGYQFHINNTYGPRILRLSQVTDFSVHGLALVDSPAFHFTLDTCANGEVYNMIVRGGNRGGLDGIDIFATNIHVHDVEVTNKDECVTVKSPANNILIENVHCNWSGGCAIGSLAGGTDIHDVVYDRIYTHHANQMMMIKSNGGSGNLSNVQFTNFQGHTNAYTLNIDAFWSPQKVAEGDGVQYTNISFIQWDGTAASNQRPPVRVLCPSAVPCTELLIDKFTVGVDSGSSENWVCQDAFGSGACLAAGTSGTYTTTQAVSPAPQGTFTTMPGELTAGLGLSASIDIPLVPTTFYPGATPASALVA